MAIRSTTNASRTTNGDGGVPGGNRPGPGRQSLHLALALCVLVLLASCERTPSKSDYVSAQVTALCEGRSGNDLRACRLAVIKQFKDTPLEEMQRRFPAPEPRARPSCGA